jgi:predicted phage terminase large subunit-like protein
VLTAEPKHLLDRMWGAVRDILGETNATPAPEMPGLGLIEYAQMMNPRYQPSAVHRFLADKLEAVERGDVQRLIITFPPRHGKTTLASIAFPAWCLGRNPFRNVIACSYAQHLANTNSRKARNQITTPGYPFPTTLAGDRAAVQQWVTNAGGEYNAAGVGGSITGMGADILIIDDYVKNIEQADSPEYRQKVWEWYTDVAYPRLHDEGVAVVIGTRWHEDDLIGRLLMNQPSQGGEGDEWTVIKLRAIAEYAPGEPDPLGRAIGEPLWPEKYTADRLLRRKSVMSSRQWQAQYQASPVAEEGGIFKRAWWRFWHHHDRPLPPVAVKLSDGREFLCPTIPLPPHMDKTIQSWDMTFKKTEEGSFIVGQVWGRVRAEAYLLDQYRRRGEFIDAVLAVRALTAAWPMASSKYIEGAANGPAIISALNKEIAGMIEVPVEGSKEARAHAITGMVESGNVILPHPMIAPWVQGFIDELAAFPAGMFNDQVDAASQGVGKLLLAVGAGAVSTERYVTWSTDPEDPWADPHERSA